MLKETISEIAGIFNETEKNLYNSDNLPYVTLFCPIILVFFSLFYNDILIPVFVFYDDILISVFAFYDNILIFLS